MEKVTIPQGFRPPHCLPFIGNGTFQRNLWVFLFQRQHNLGYIHVHALGPVAGKNAGFHGKPPVCMLHPTRGGENKKTLCRHQMPYTVFHKHTQRPYTMLAEMGFHVYNKSQVWDEISLCRRHYRLRRLWRVPALHSCRVVLASPKNNFAVVIIEHDSCKFNIVFWNNNMNHMK